MKIHCNSVWVFAIFGGQACLSELMQSVLFRLRLAEWASSSGTTMLKPAMGGASPVETLGGPSVFRV